MDTDLTLDTNQIQVTGNNKSIIVPQKVIPTNLTTIEEKISEDAIDILLQVLIVPLSLKICCVVWCPSLLLSGNSVL